MGNNARSVLYRLAPLFIAGLSASLAFPSAWAQARQLDFDFKEEAGYGRIIVSWANSQDDAPRITANMTGPVLVLKFDEPVQFDPEELNQGLPSYIAVARLTEDGREARLALSNEFRIHQSYSVNLAGIDLVSPGMPADPADVVSPLAEIRRKQAQELAAKKEAERLAALPKPKDVRVRASAGQDFSTLAFYWPDAIDYTAKDTGDKLQLTFSSRGKADFSIIRVDPPLGMTGITERNTDENWVVDIDLKEGYWASPIKVDESVLVRFREGKKPDNGLLEDTILPEALKKLAEKLPAKEEDKSFAPPSKKPFETFPKSLAEEDKKQPEPEKRAEKKIEKTEPKVRVEPDNQLAEETPRRLWNSALFGGKTAKVAAVPKAGGLEIDVSFTRDIPGAVFRHRGAVWLAFPAAGEFELSKDVLNIGYRIDQVRSDEGMALRVNAPADKILSIKQSGKTWSVAIGGQGDLASQKLEPKRTASQGGSGIVVNVPNIGTVFDLEYAATGETLTIVPATTHTISLDRSLNFVDVSLPATLQGLVVVPTTDDVEVIQRGEDVYISRPQGLSLSNWGVTTDLGSQGDLTPGFLDFAAWRRGDVDDFWPNANELDHQAAISDPEDWSGQKALLDLARFYLAWHLAPESYGPLKIAAAADPILEQDTHWLSLKGAADVMNGRYGDALELFDKGGIRSDASAQAWKGLALTEVGDWRKARDAFLAADPIIDAYVPYWAGRFHAAAARANIRMGDGAKAERHADAARRAGDEVAIGQASLTLGELAEAAGRTQDAMSIYTRLLDHSDANVRVRAELASIKLARKEKKMSPLDASDRLDTLRFRWRGDALELEIIASLIENLFELGRFRDSLTLAQSVSMQFPDMPGSRELRITMMKQFEELYLNGKADRMDPIMALALFYEFKDLTPIGPDGDRMIRKLAGRLVAFDLLDPATELLSHQVDNRNLIGAGRAKIASDLAAIYLMDDRPEEALRTISSTRQTGLDKELRLERRLLEAAAHMELKRYGHAIELLETVDDQRALDLLAEVHWRARTWGAAGRALQGTLPKTPTSLTAQQTQTALRSAVAYRMDGDFDGLAKLRSEYLAAMSKTSEADAFDLLTGQTNVSSARLTDTVRTLADTTTANAFIAGLKQRFGSAGGIQ